MSGASKPAEPGLLWGAYHFGEAGPAMPQVLHFLDTVQPAPTDLLVLDFEEYGTDTMALESAELFVDEAYVLTGRWVGLYTGMAFCGSTLGDCTETPLARSWLWMARYSPEEPSVPPAWETFTLWQFCDDGTDRREGAYGSGASSPRLGSHGARYAAMFSCTDGPVCALGAIPAHALLHLPAALDAAGHHEPRGGVLLQRVLPDGTGGKARGYWAYEADLEAWEG